MVFSSHVVSELERIADYLVVLNEGRLQLAGEVDALLDTHRILTGPGGEMALNLKQFAVVQAVRQARRRTCWSGRRRRRDPAPAGLAVVTGQPGRPGPGLPARPEGQRPAWP